MKQAVAVLYKISLYRQGKEPGKADEYQAVVHSCWRQTALVFPCSWSCCYQGLSLTCVLYSGADWLLCSQMVAYSD